MNLRVVRRSSIQSSPYPQLKEFIICDSRLIALSLWCSDFEMFTGINRHRARPRDPRVRRDLQSTFFQSETNCLNVCVFVLWELQPMTTKLQTAPLLTCWNLGILYPRPLWREVMLTRLQTCPFTTPQHTLHDRSHRSLSYRIEL